VDPGYPKPTGIRQAMLMLPPGTEWEGLKLKAELEVKGVRSLIRAERFPACRCEAKFRFGGLGGLLCPRG
jgi:hypothetical protein